MLQNQIGIDVMHGRYWRKVEQGYSWYMEEMIDGYYGYCVYLADFGLTWYIGLEELWAIDLRRRAHVFLFFPYISFVVCIITRGGSEEYLDGWLFLLFFNFFFVFSNGVGGMGFCWDAFFLFIRLLIFFPPSATV